MEDFITFEIAKKLNEKGFRERCLTYYDVEDNVGLLYNTQYSDDILPCQYTDLLASHNANEVFQPDSRNCVDAPSISQVLKWLREEKHIAINITFIPVCWQFTVLPMSFNENRFKLSGKTFYFSYEQAALAGIEYVLDNLI